MTPTNCPYCGAELPAPSERGGRPRRWCSDGCATAGEASMRRINTVLRRLHDQQVFAQLNNTGHAERVDKVLAAWQAKYDHLAGVPAKP